MTLQHLSHRQIIGVSVQGTLGTPADPVTHLVPVTSFSAREVYEQVLDNGRRGPDSMDFRAVQGVGHSELTIEGVIQMNGATGSPIGMFLRSILATGAAGAEVSPYITPTEIPTTSGVYRHYRSLGTTKEYLTVQQYDNLVAANFIEYEGCRCTDLTIRWNSGEGAITYTATLIGRIATKQTDTMADLSAQDVTLEDPIQGWRAAAVLLTVADTTLISSEWTLSRTANRQYASGAIQNYKDLYLGPLSVVCSMVIDYNDVVLLDKFRAGTQGEISNTFLVDSVGQTAFRGFGIGGTKFSLLEAPAEINSSAEQMTLAISARGLYDIANGPLSADYSITHLQNGPIETVTYEQATASY